MILFKPEANFAIVGLSQEDSQITTLSTLSVNEDAMEAPKWWRWL
ncbi:MAG: hypothetical protein R2880_18685 [Deinococcales bacterium]